MKTFLSTLVIALTCICSVNAVITQISNIDDITTEITPNSLLLLNVAEVLTDSEVSLGTQAWRKYLRKRVNSQTHDELTLYIFKTVPSKPVEKVTPELISKLQQQGTMVLALTSRGRNEWYKSKVMNIDLLTEKVLLKMNIDFSLTKLPPKLSEIDKTLPEYFHKGIIYTGNDVDKGEFLLNLIQKTGYTPSKIVFVDDKVDSLQSVENALHATGIPFIGYAYARTAQEHADFDPMIANIQLSNLITQNKLLSDEQALNLKKTQYSKANPDEFFDQIIKTWNDLLK